MAVLVSASLTLLGMEEGCACFSSMAAGGMLAAIRQAVARRKGAA
ncbi:MAG: hypothetical protein AB1705_16200 [Verrucomicrobiota bacterium]